MTQKIDYNQIAGTYAQTRAAAPWIVETLARHIRTRPTGALILEVGCGTGNHSRALAEELPHYQFAGFDQSTAMLQEAQAIPSSVTFQQGDAERAWPHADRSVDLIFCVDVIHYIRNLEAFFQEAQRVLKDNGRLLIATDSEADLRNRSLTRFFPEILEHELARYPTPNALEEAATVAGLIQQGADPVAGTHPITDAHVANLAAKCSSALRLISSEAHAAGVARVRQAQAAGVAWHSLYTIYQYTIGLTHSEFDTSTTS